VTAGLDAAEVTALPAGQETARVRFVPRPVPPAWVATAASRQGVLARLTVPPFTLDTAGSQEYRVGGLNLLLSWLEDQPGGSWHERWLASGADTAGSRWRELPAAWLAGRGECSASRGRALCGALHVVDRPGFFVGLCLPDSINLPFFPAGRSSFPHILSGEYTCKRSAVARCYTSQPIPESRA
jgi:hypothetical protein